MGFTREDTKAAKAAAVILMCMHHLFAFPDRFPVGVAYISLFPWDLENALGHVGRICVAIFVCLSGFGTYLALEMASNPWKTALGKIWGLYKKFWAVFLVFIPLAVILKDPQVQPTLPELAGNFSGMFPTYNGEWWFLPPFLVLTALAPLVVRPIRANRLGWLWWALAFAAQQLFMPEFRYESRSVTAIFHNALVFIPGFWLGCLMAKHRLFDRYMDRVGPWLSLGIITALILARMAVGQMADPLLAPVMCAAAAAVARGIRPLGKIMAELGSVSTEIWLIHSFWCYHFIPELLFAPRYSALVLLFLLALSYGSGKAIILASNCIKRASR